MPCPPRIFGKNREESQRTKMRKEDECRNDCRPDEKEREEKESERTPPLNEGGGDLVPSRGPLIWVFFPALRHEGSVCCCACSEREKKKPDKSERREQKEWHWPIRTPETMENYSFAKTGKIESIFLVACRKGQ